MKDARVAAFRTALESLMASLEATVRIARWVSADAIPDPLKKAASQIEERLAAATKLAETKVVGAPQVTARITAMADLIRRLNDGYSAYRSETSDAPEKAADAALALDEVIAEVKDTDNRIA